MADLTLGRFGDRRLKKGGVLNARFVEWREWRTCLSAL